MAISMGKNVQKKGIKRASEGNGHKGETEER